MARINLDPVVRKIGQISFVFILVFGTSLSLQAEKRPAWLVLLQGGSVMFSSTSPVQKGRFIIVTHQGASKSIPKTLVAGIYQRIDAKHNDTPQAPRRSIEKKLKEDFEMKTIGQVKTSHPQSIPPEMERVKAPSVNP